MARPKEFDRNDALHKAMEVFWSRGYESASIQDLVEHMGINRQSLYDTFGDKHALYLEALDRYRDVETRKLFELLESTSLKKALQQLFAEVVKGSPGKGHRRGCFMGNAMSELAGRCEATAARTTGNMAAVEGAFYRAIQRAKKSGELKAVRDPRAVARFLYCNLQGLMLMAKATPDHGPLKDVVKITLSVVK